MPFKVFSPGFLSTTDMDSLLMSQVIIRCTSITRPTSPQEGWHIYETDTQKLKVFVSGIWVDDFGANLDVIKIKPTDESSGSTTDHTDSFLIAPVEANSVYTVRTYLHVTSTVVGTILDLDFGIPSGANIFFSTNHPAVGEEGRINVALRQTGAIGLQIAVSTLGTVTQIHGLLRTGATAGNFTIIWRTTNGTSTLTMKANSTIKLRKIPGAL